MPYFIQYKMGKDFLGTTYIAFIDIKLVLQTIGRPDSEEDEQERSLQLLGQPVVCQPGAYRWGGNGYRTYP